MMTPAPKEVGLKIIFEIDKNAYKSENEYTNEAILFDARNNYLAASFGNSSNISINVASISKEYEEEYGLMDDRLNGYPTFLADCFKHNFIITKINGIPATLDPFRQAYVTKETTIEIELEEIK